MSRALAATPALLVKADRSSYLNPFSDEGDTSLKPGTLSADRDRAQLVRSRKRGTPPLSPKDQDALSPLQPDHISSRPLGLG